MNTRQYFIKIRLIETKKNGKGHNNYGRGYPGSPLHIFRMRPGFSPYVLEANDRLEGRIKTIYSPRKSFRSN